MSTSRGFSAGVSQAMRSYSMQLPEGGVSGAYRGDGIVLLGQAIFQLKWINFLHPIFDYCIQLGCIFRHGQLGLSIICLVCM